MASLKEYDFIVVGAGLGGLMVAAHLSKAGKRVLVLERGQTIGGKCSTRVVHGSRFAVGTNTVGIQISKRLAELGIYIEWIRAPFLLYGDGATIGFPPSFAWYSSLARLGVSMPQFALIVARLLRNMNSDTKTYSALIAEAVKDARLRELFFVEPWFLGAHPQWLAAQATRVFFGLFYGYHKPIYPALGADAIPQALASSIRAHDGEIRVGVEVSAIGVENMVVKGVEVGNEWISARCGVISNADYRQTMRLVKPTAEQPVSTTDSGFHRGWSFAQLHMQLDRRKAKAVQACLGENGVTTHVLFDAPILDSIADLEHGVVATPPVINLVMADAKAQALADPSCDVIALHAATLWPDTGGPTGETLNRLTDSILASIDARFAGFSSAVLWHEWMTPERFEKELEFSSCAAPLLEGCHQSKPSWRLPVARLYNVGTSVQPRGWHAGSALESGRRCAIDILSH